MNLRAVLLPLLLCPQLALFAQLAGFRVQGATATQAVIAYTAPDSRACRIEVSEGPRYIPLVPDVDPRLFSLANQDLERGSTIVSQRERIVVIGQRVAEMASDGRRYSRALQAYTKHYVRITCGSVVHETTLQTTNIPIGLTYNDPLPADPSRPGEFAWPTVDWSDRFQRIVDPKTGLLIRRLSTGEDVSLGSGNQPFAAGLDLEGAWSNPGAATANDNQSATAQETGWLFLDAARNLYHGGTRNYPGYSLNTYRLDLNSWCENCGNIAAAARTIEACLTVDGFSCAGRTLEAVVESCSTDCTGARYRFAMGGTSSFPVNMGWGMDNYDITDYQRRSGEVIRQGNQVRQTGGYLFHVNWRPGSRISINGKTYTIAKVNHETLLTLEGDPEGEEAGSYIGSNFGVLLRRKTAGAGRIAVQFANQSYVVGDTPDWDAGGDEETFTGCGPQRTAGPGGEPGWHCVVGTMLYWIGEQSGTVNRLGQAILASRGGADGWGGPGYCNQFLGGGPIWDYDDPDAFYCGAQDNSGGTIIVKAKYFGQNTDIGPSTFGWRLLECNATRGNSPCWEFTNLTPSSLGQNLNQQVAQIHPAEWSLLRNSTLNMYDRKGRRLQIYTRDGNASNDAIGFIGVFDLTENRVTAAMVSWKYWPLRWAVLHGIQPMFDEEWVFVPGTFFRGSAAGREFVPGYGPYFSRITSGPVSATGSACPDRPANSPIAPHEWPSGDRCLEFTVDGEPGDPTPLYVNDGTVSTTGAVVTGSNTNWRREYTGAWMRMEGRWYRFEYVSPTSGRLTPEPQTPLRNAAYELYLEPVNSGKTGNPLHAYLQDAEPRDLLVLSNTLGFAHLYGYTEYVRLLMKQGNRWTVERAVAHDSVPVYMLPLNANAYVVPMVSSCLLGPTYPCASSVAGWNAITDPNGKNGSGTSIVVDRTDFGYGHVAAGPTAAIASVAEECPVIDGLAYGCYNVRPGRGFLERARNGVNYGVSLNPAFEGRAGIGTPNQVDGHPSFKQLAEIASPGDLDWFVDARPFFGHSSVTGSSEDPGVAVEEGLYKFVPAQLPRLRPKYMPTLAYCGAHPLRDISGPASRIGGGNENPYTYCVARGNGECREDSSPGELYVSCPVVSYAHCRYPGVGSAGADQNDICVVDNGAHVQAITQVRHTEPDLDGRGSRVLTYGFSQYRFNDVFWNVKVTPDAKWLLFRGAWVNGRRSEVFMAKLPPFEPVDDQARNGYQYVEVKVAAGPFAGAMLEFGYNPAFECTSRHEPCVARQAGPGVEPFYYAATEQYEAVPCNGGCSLQMPVIAQRTVYFRIRQYGEDGKPVGVSSTNVWAFQ